MKFEKKNSSWTTGKWPLFLGGHNIHTQRKLLLYIQTGIYRVSAKDKCKISSVLFMHTYILLNSL